MQTPIFLVVFQWAFATTSYWKGRVLAPVPEKNSEPDLKPHNPRLLLRWTPRNRQGATNELAAKFPGDPRAKIWSGSNSPFACGRRAFLRAMSQRDGDLTGAHPEEGDRHAVRMDGSDDDELDQPVSATTRSSVLCHSESESRAWDFGVRRSCFS